jgi:hypothetical protein
MMEGATNPPARATISACLITKDEERALPDCLRSLAFVDEIVVVDSGSTDRTVAIAREHGARVVEQPWLGFAAQRNVALENSSCDWALEVDADELVSAPLREEILAFLAQSPAGIDIAAMPRREILVGHRLGRSAKYPKYCHRLVRRDTYRHDERRTVHEGFAPAGEVFPFDGELEHVLAVTWGEALRDAWRYARLEAAQLTGRRSAGEYLAGILVRPAVKLFYRLTIDGGWRDGAPGLAKIALDVGTDSAVWTLHLLGADGAGESGAGESGHYGSRRFGVGTQRLVGLALDERSARSAQSWLAAAHAAGADTALVAPAESVDGVRTRRPEGRSPLAAIRALDAEAQLRPIDALVPFGAPARALSGTLAPELRGERRDVTAATPPDRAAVAAREQT